MFRPNRTKHKLVAGGPAYGLIHSFACSQVAEMIGLAGYDFVMIDGEHGLGDFASHLACLQAVSATPATSILRVPSRDLTPIKRALDLGVEGILVPDVRTPEQAQAVAGACFYPPRGSRGFSAGTVRSSDYGLSVAEYVEAAAGELLLCLMIESAEGVANVREIAETDGVDVIQVGPFDLSYDLGIAGQFDHPDFAGALAEIESGVKAAGKILGGVPLPGLPLEEALNRGYKMMTMGADMPMLAAALQKGLPADS